MLRPPWPTPPMSSNAPQQPAEIASLRAAPISCEFAPASLSYRDWSRPRAKSVSSIGDKPAPLLFVPPATAAPHTQPQDEFLPAPPGRCPAEYAPARFPLGHPPCALPLPYLHARSVRAPREIRTASAAPYPPDSLCRVSP